MAVSFTIDRDTTVETDGGEAGVVDPGDTLRTKVTITNTGDQSATNTTFHDSFFGSTLVGEPNVNISPIAFNDAFTAVGNTVLRVGGAANIGTGPSLAVAGNLLSNDVGAITGDDVPGFQIDSVTGGTSAGGGTFNVFSDGSFNYVNQAGDTGSDSFTYTIRDAGLDGTYNTADDLTSTATVTITLSGEVWYIDSAAAGGGTGTSANPFNSLTQLNGVTGDGTTNDDVDGASDYIYVKGSVSGSLVLEASQQLIGQGASLDVGAFHLADAGTDAQISHSNFGVQLDANNTISGIDFVGTNVVSVAIRDGGISAGNLTISQTEVSGVGQIVDIDNGGALNVTFESVGSNGSSGTGGVIDLAGVTGTFTVTGATTLTTSVGTHNQAGIDIGGAGTNLTANFAGGTSLTMGSNASASGVNLTTNSGSTTFAGLDITTNSAAAFAANSAGTVAVTGGGNIISSTTGTAVNITSTTIGASGVTLQSVSANGAANGIVLNNTGSTGGFTVTGDGAAANNGSGGTIQNSTGEGIVINNASNVSLNQMNVTNSGTDGLNIDNINGLTLNRLNITDNSSTSALNHNGIRIGDFTSGTAVNGTINITNTSVTFSSHDNLAVGIGSGTSTWNVTGSTFSFSGGNGSGDGSADVGGNSGVNFEIRNNAVVSLLTFTGNTIEGNYADGMQISPAGGTTGSLIANISNNTFKNNNIALDLNSDASADMTYFVLNNSIINDTRTATSGVDGTSHAVNVFMGTTSTSAASLNLRFEDNVIGNNSIAGSGSSFGNGLRVNFNGNGNGTALIDGNQIYEAPTGRGMEIIGRNGTGQLDITVTNNTVDHTNLGYNPGTSDFPLAGIFIQSNVVGVSGYTVRADVRSNTVTGSGTLSDLGAGWIHLQETSTSNLQLVDDPAGPGGQTAAQQLSLANPSSTSTSASSGVSLIAGPINLPPSPLLAAALPEAPPPASPAEEPATDDPAPEQTDDPAPDPAPPTDTGGDEPQPVSPPTGPVVVDDGVLSQAELDLILAAAVERWHAAGANQEQIQAMLEVEVSVSDLGGLVLGASQPGTIVLDDNAAGWRWFVDATAGDDSEYTGSGTVLSAADPYGEAGTRMDLLTVLMHELGHQIGLEDLYVPGETDELMYGTIRAGERRLPGADDLAAATGVAVTGAFAISPINLGTLPAGQSVTIEWLHTVDTPTEDGLVGGGGTAYVDSDQTLEVASLSEIVAVDGLTLGNLVYLDVNLDGDYDSGTDSGVVGVTLTLYGDTNNNGVYDAGTDLYIGYNELGGGAGYQQGIDTPAAAGTGTALTATTNASGNYVFNFLAPGDYIVVVDAANFNSGNPLEDKVIWPSANDSDDDVDNDNNGQNVSGTVATRAITLGYGGEPTAGPTGPANDTNLTLDLGFVELNDAPVNSLGGTIGTGEDAIDAWLSGMSITDPDADLANDDVRVTFAVGNGTLDIRTDVVGGVAAGDVTGDDTGTIVVTATLNEINATLAAVNGLTYSPTANFNGDDTLTVTTNDQGHNGLDPGLSGDATSEEDIDTRTISVSAADDAPVAQPDAVATPENVVLTGGAGSLFGNNGSGVDADVDGDPLTISAVNGVGGNVGTQITLASGALLTVNADGSYSYDPNGQFNTLTNPAGGETGAVNTSAPDSFTYTLTGGNTVTVTVTINGVAGPGDWLRGDGGANTITGTGAGDLFMLHDGGDDTASGLGGDDGFYFGGAFTSADNVDGGAGTLDQVALQGNYSGGLTFGANSFTNVEMLVLLPGNDTRFGDTANNFYDYDLTTIDGNVGAGQTFSISFNRLRPGEDVTFDGSAETDGAFVTYGGFGSDDLTGGGGDDKFFFGTGRFDAGDSVDGGGGTDQLILKGAYSAGLSFGAGQLANIETIVCMTAGDLRANGTPGGLYSYDLTMNQGNLSAAQILTIDASTLIAGENLDFDASAETDGGRYVVTSGAGADTLVGGSGDDELRGAAGVDQITGGLGADQLYGGAGNDSFVYLVAGDSTLVSQDHLFDFTTGDKIDLALVDAIAGGANDAFSFIGSAAFSNTAGELRAVLQSGNDWLVEADTNGDSTADFALLVTVADSHSIVVGDFLL